MTIILDNSCGKNNQGKCSPDGRICEYEYTRKLVKAIAEKLKDVNIKVHILTPEDYDVSVAERVRRANEIYAKDKGAFLVSCHLNGAGINKQWMSARGWSVFISNTPSSDDKRLANDMYRSAFDCNLTCRRPSADQNYWKQNLYLCKNSKCPTVITENLFADNKEDVSFLLSERGFNTIVDLHVNAIKAYISGK